MTNVKQSLEAISGKYTDYECKTIVHDALKEARVVKATTRETKDLLVRRLEKQEENERLLRP
jgi:hypothetical protein